MVTRGDLVVPWYVPGMAGRWLSWLLVGLVPACGGDSDGGGADAGPGPDADRRGWSAAPALPEAVGNNAVAAVETAAGCVLVSATGIGVARAAAAIHTRAWILDAGAAGWAVLDDAPGPARIAASAVALGGAVYLLGGYQVGADGGETTDTTVARLDLGTRQWQARAPLPIAIDDAVAVAWRDRWIVVVSGWSNTAPVAAVQLYDSTLDQWSAATPFPGAAVFGHAGALVGDELILVDGVTAGPRGFALTSQAWRGRLDPAAPTAITWDELPAHPAPARYRAAAGALAGQIVIHAGTDDPYNFDGLSYDTARPSPPRADSLVLGADGVVAGVLPAKPVATMDHRALVTCGGAAFTIGGMVAGPAVTDQVWRYQP